jgi:hypothetical protein
MSSQLSVENKLFSPAFFRDQVPKFRLWLDELLREIFEAAHVRGDLRAHRLPSDLVSCRTPT